MTGSVAEFYEQLCAALNKHLPAAEIQEIENNPFRLKARVVISQATFIDVFYGARKERIDFALIHEGRRVFGIDNLHYWHCHPFGRESTHERISPMSIEEIVIELKKAIHELANSTP